MGVGGNRRKWILDILLSKTYKSSNFSSISISSASLKSVFRYIFCSLMRVDTQSPTIWCSPTLPCFLFVWLLRTRTEKDAGGIVWMKLRRRKGSSSQLRRKYCCKYCLLTFAWQSETSYAGYSRFDGKESDGTHRKNKKFDTLKGVI